MKKIRYFCGKINMGMYNDTRKIIQALAYLAERMPEKTIENRKAFKLLWLADRYHLRKTGRTVTGDTYYAMPHGIVPSDTKCLLENEKTKLQNPRGYKESFIELVNGHQYKAIAAPDLNVFSDSDQDALDLILSRFGDYDAQQLSDLSHRFPEWLHYQHLLEDENAKNSYKIDPDLFFEDGPDTEKNLFDDSAELLEITKTMFHQYNRM